MHFLKKLNLELNCQVGKAKILNIKQKNRSTETILIISVKLHICQMVQKTHNKANKFISTKHQKRCRRIKKQPNSDQKYPTKVVKELPKKARGHFRTKIIELQATFQVNRKYLPKLQVNFLTKRLLIETQTVFHSSGLTADKKEQPVLEELLQEKL